MAKQKRVSNMDGLESSLNNVFVRRLPALPVWLTDLTVVLLPWLTILWVLAGIPLILGWLGMTSFGWWDGMERMMYWGRGRGGYWGGTFGLGAIAAAGQLVLHIMAIKGLFARRLSGWRLLFYSCLVQAAYYVVTFNLVSLVIGTGISLYFLFQVRRYYR